MKYSQIDLVTDLEEKLQYVLNGQKCYFLNQKKIETKG